MECPYNFYDTAMNNREFDSFGGVNSQAACFLQPGEYFPGHEQLPYRFSDGTDRSYDASSESYAPMLSSTMTKYCPGCDDDNCCANEMPDDTGDSSFVSDISSLEMDAIDFMEIEPDQFDFLDESIDRMVQSLFEPYGEPDQEPLLADPDNVSSPEEETMLDESDSVPSFSAATPKADITSKKGPPTSMILHPRVKVLRRWFC